ncbi:MAG: ROK family protein [Pseudomonadota bacterium]
MTAERHLLIDLGGTHTRVARGGPDGLIQHSIRTYKNRAFAGLGQVLDAFLQDQPGQVTALCAGVAGPVQENTAQLTNFDWFIDGPTLKAQTGARHVALINDLQAQGYALDDVPASAIHTVKPGTQSGPTRMVLNLGTGCNCAVVHRVADQLYVPAAESGHSALPHARNDLHALFEHLRQDQAHLPIEAILSGPGLARVHAWVTGQSHTPEAVMDAINAGDDTAHQTLSLFLKTLGAVAGNLALHHLPLGGIYLSGGLSQALTHHIDHEAFLTAFSDKGPYTDIVRAMPVSVIADDGFALHGCQRVLAQTL